jgi:hypothetical protein
MKKRSITPQRVAVIGFIISVFFISAAAPVNNAPFCTNVNLSSQGDALRLGDTPDDPYYPSNKPFFQAPLSLTPHDHFWLSRPLRDEILTWRTADYRYGGLKIAEPEKRVY